MSQPPPFPPPFPSPIAPYVIDSDESHLKLLTIFHFVVAGLTALFACFGLMYVGMGVLFIQSPESMFPTMPTPTTSPVSWSTTVTSNGTGSVTTGRMAVNPMPGPPPAIGWFFIAIGSVVLLLGWTLAALLLYSGLCMRKRRRRMLSLIVAGAACIFFPFGTALGVFTIIVLVRASVEAKYRQAELAGV